MKVMKTKGGKEVKARRRIIRKQQYSISYLPNPPNLLISFPMTVTPVTSPTLSTPSLRSL